MPKENPNLDIPLDEGEISKVTDGKSELSQEDIVAELNRRKEAEKLENTPVKDPNKADALEIDPNDKPIQKEEDLIIDPRLVGRTVEELQKMYLNVEALQKSQTDELGELRIENKNFKNKEKQSETLNLHEIEKKIMPEVQSWTPEKRAEWFKLFNEEPEKAMTQVIRIVMKPYTKRQAVSNNAEEVRRLKTLHAKDVVPYVEKDIDALIAANEGWWKKYGTGIFEHAYDVVRNRDFSKNATIIQANIKAKEGEEVIMEEENKNQTFVEGQRPAKIIQSKKVITHQQIKDLEPDEGMTMIAKELLRRGVKVDR